MRSAEKGQKTMKTKWYLFSSIFQLVVGVLAVAAFIILAINGEDMGRWVVTFLLAIAFCILGILGIIDYCKKGK